MHPFIAEQLIADRAARAHEAARRHRLVQAARTVRFRRTGRSIHGATRAAVVAVAAAAVVMIVAPVAFGGAFTRSDAEPSAVPPPVEPITLVGLTTGAVERVSYEAGASREWSPDGRIVSVTIVSGSLTVYGVEGERRVYGKGEGYAAGWTAYRAVNEADEPLDKWVVSYER